MTPASPRTVLGIDRLFAGPGRPTGGLRLGLVTNEAALDGSGRPCVRRFVEEGARVERIFAPEHGYGLAYAEGARFGPDRHPEYAIPIVPFYGEGLKLTPAAVDGLDLLVFDLPNVGVRCHTYLANLVEALRFSARERVPLLVLDRPNALGGERVEGPAVEPHLIADVAPVPVPFCHGLTALELCRWVARAEGLDPPLREVPMQGWRRAMGHDDTHLAWKAPSPNLPAFQTALCYPMTVWLEGTNVSEGRGTARPFETFGAPWLEPGRLLEALGRHPPAGVRLGAAEPFTPSCSKHAGQLCRALEVAVIDRSGYRPLEAGLRLVAEIRRLWPAHFEWLVSARTGIAFIDRLVGTAAYRVCLEEGGQRLDEVLAGFAREAAAFAARRGEISAYES